eukprot:366196-Chlamydomonas_euryale.AAC.23
MTCASGSGGSDGSQRISKTEVSRAWLSAMSRGRFCMCDQGGKGADARGSREARCLLQVQWVKNRGVD